MPRLTSQDRLLKEADRAVPTGGTILSPTAQRKKCFALRGIPFQEFIRLRSQIREAGGSKDPLLRVAGWAWTGAASRALGEPMQAWFLTLALCPGPRCLIGAASNSWQTCYLRRRKCRDADRDRDVGDFAAGLGPSRRIYLSGLLGRMKCPPLEAEGTDDKYWPCRVEATISSVWMRLDTVQVTSGPAVHGAGAQQLLYTAQPVDRHTNER